MLATYPHDDDAFTQGFTYFDGHIYEGTGLNGKSSLRKLDPNNHSKSLQTFDIPEQFFGEGVTHYKDGKGNDRFIQLTWRERTAFVYDAKNMDLLFTFKYHVETSNGEGWGITYDRDQNEFIVSDGSEYLFFWDVSSLDECESVHDAKVCNLVMEAKRMIKVHAYTSQSSPAIPVIYLNELEFVRSSSKEGVGSIFANVWYEEYILEICPTSGVVLKLHDLSPLCPVGKETKGNVLNGVSVSEEGNRILYVTGKLWSYSYKIELI